MPRKKKTIKKTIKEDIISEDKTQETPSAEVAVEESSAKKDFRKWLEQFKTDHPAKYEIRKAEFEKQLNQL